VLGVAFCPIQVGYITLVLRICRMRHKEVEPKGILLVWRHRPFTFFSWGRGEGKVSGSSSINKLCYDIISYYDAITFAAIETLASNSIAHTVIISFQGMQLIGKPAI
jgi:hypothetical protein